MNTTVITTQDKQVLDPFMQAGEKALEEANALIITTVDESNDAFRRDRDHYNKIVKDVETARKMILQPMRIYADLVNVYAKKISKPALDARLIIKEKILAFKEEEERKRVEEEKRIDAICSKISTYNDLDTLNTAMETVEELDRSFPKIQLAYSNRKAYLERKIAEEEEAKERAAEKAKLDKIAKEQSAERAKLEADKLKHKQDMRDLDRRQAEADRVIEANALKKKQEEEEKAAAKNKTLGGRTAWDFEITDFEAIPCELKMIDEKKVRELIRSGERHVAGINIFQKTT